MRRATTIVIGAGHAGLAMSRCLSERSIDHVVLERGEVAHSWRTERWASLRLLTPNWQSRLPGLVGVEGDPHAYRSMPEVIGFVERYALAIRAPVETNTRVTALRQTDGGYWLETERGPWLARSVVIASGACNLPNVPTIAEMVPPSIMMVTPHTYRCPEQLPPGGVLVVGASATGLQLAEEIQCSGRRVILAVGDHVRVPRTYRERDIQYWLDCTGVLDQGYREVPDIVRARRLPSFQLIGSPERRTLDLNRLSGMGVELVGRVVGAYHGRLQFSGSLSNYCALADLKLNRLLDLIDEQVCRADSGSAAPEREGPTIVPNNPRLSLDLASGEIAAIIWATGYRPDYSWLEPTVLDRKGQLVHDGGVVASPGLYAMGLPFMRRRKSTLLDGAGDDARDLADHLAHYLAGVPSVAPQRNWQSAA